MYMSVAVNLCASVTAGSSLIGQMLVRGKARLKATHQLWQLQRHVSHRNVATYKFLAVPSLDVLAGTDAEK